jgi:hypothetical protein
VIRVRAVAIIVVVAGRSLGIAVVCLSVGWGVVVVSLVSVHFFGFSPGRAHLGISISP